MKTIEQIMKEQNREPFYDYYLSLGYAHKVAASLALFTYGAYRFDHLSIDELYDALCRGEEYIPEQVRIERERAARERERAAREQEHAAREREHTEKMRERARKGGGRKTYRLFAKAGRSSGQDQPGASMPMMAAPPAESTVKKCIADIEALEEPELMCSYSAPMDGPMYFTGGGFSTDEYEPIEEKNARSTAIGQTSSFRMTTNTASAGVILNQLRNGRRIDSSMVRIEEMLNYFRYDSPVPEDEMFGISCELMDTDDAKKYLYVHVQGREEVKERQNIVLLLDVSGSMNFDRQETQAIVATIVSKLGNGDRFSLVTYSSEDHVELEAFTVNGAEDRVRILEQLLSIKISGWTHGSKGIERAYEIGKKHFIPGGNNQVILITDGDLNFGITDKGGLEELIEKKKQDDLFLSVIGTGLFNFKDDKLETLSKHGNGVYRVVNDLKDVKKSIDEEYSSLVNIIAKDVKAQVEFNPEIVESYRLLGFENREIAHEDFANDQVISEPFGSGGYGVALYELTMRTGDAPVESGFKYSRIVTTGSKEPGTVRIRYKEPLEDVSHELEKVIETADASYTDNLRLAFIVYVCAEKLRGSDKITEKEIDLAKQLYRELGGSIREKNAADLYKLAGILEKSEEELGIGIQETEDFPW